MADAVRALLPLLVFGAVFLWYGVTTPFLWWTSVVGAVALAVGLVLEYLSVRSWADDLRNKTKSSRGASSTFSTTESPTIIEREIVRVRCRYCGTLNDTTDSSCSSCGARL